MPHSWRCLVVAAACHCIIMSSASTAASCEDSEIETTVSSNALLQKTFTVAESLSPSKTRSTPSSVKMQRNDTTSADASSTINGSVPLWSGPKPAIAVLLEADVAGIPAGLLALFAVFLTSILSVLYCYSAETYQSEEVPQDLYSTNEKGKVYSYNNEKLLTWNILFQVVPFIVMRWRVWLVLPCVLGTACVFATATSFQVGYVKGLNTDKISEFSSYLRVFIAFMLGMFLNTSFSRWTSIVNNFRTFTTAIKQLMWSVHLMNLRQVLVDELQRSCLVACYILDAEMHLDLGCTEDAWEPLWNSTFSHLRQEGLLLEKEEQDFRNEKGRFNQIDFGRYSTVTWSWIGKLVAKIREEPGIQVPMYMGLVNLCNSCVAEVDQLKTCIHVQVPFTYAYLLSIIVHMNNVLIGVSSGLRIGKSLSGISSGLDASGLTDAIEQFAMQLLILLIQPVMYQACLVIAHILNHPFGDHAFHLPTETFILLLRDELHATHKSFRDHQFSAEVTDKDAHQETCQNAAAAVDASSDSCGGDGDDDGDDAVEM